MSITRLLRERVAALSNCFHSPISYWLELPLDELQEWMDIAERMNGNENI